MLQIKYKTSGTKTWCYVTSDNPAILHIIARRLNTEVKFDGRGRHLDLTIRQANQAVQIEQERRQS